MQHMHSSPQFGVGSLIGPMIVRAFLYTEVNDINQYVDPAKIKIAYAYVVSGAYCFVVTVMFIGVSLKYHSSRKSKNNKLPEGKYDNVRPRVRMLILAIGSIMLFFYFALEIAFGSFIMAFGGELVTAVFQPTNE